MKKKKTIPNNQDLQYAYIQYWNPWLSSEEKEYWKGEIKRLHLQQSGG